jgi:hypothetical protein
MKTITRQDVTNLLTQAAQMAHQRQLDSLEWKEWNRIRLDIVEICNRINDLKDE